MWRSRGRPGPTAPGTPAGPQATPSMRRPPPTSAPNAAGVEGAGGMEGQAAVPVGDGVARLRCPWATAGPGCGAHGQQRHYRLPNFARNLSWSFFETPQKRCNSNVANSMFEQVAGELRAKLMGGGGAWPGSEVTRRTTHQYTRRRRCGGHRRDLPQCRWAVAGPGRASRRRAERSSRRGRLAGGPPPTGTHSGRAHRRPEHPWGHKQHKQEGRHPRAQPAARPDSTPRGRPGPPAPETPVGPQRNEAATGFPATASSRSRSAVHNSATSNQAVMST